MFFTGPYTLLLPKAFYFLKLLMKDVALVTDALPLTLSALIVYEAQT
jgi:hypothetical protein